MPACRHIDLDSPGLGQEGDREETARLFLELGARQWAAIDAAWRQRSTRDLSREIHKLRGSLAIVGAKAALMRAGVIEKACGTGWPAGHEQTFRELETEFAAVCAEMSRL